VKTHGVLEKKQISVFLFRFIIGEVKRDFDVEDFIHIVTKITKSGEKFRI